jgi:hypothetical protein
MDRLIHNYMCSSLSPLPLWVPLMESWSWLMVYCVIRNFQQYFSYITTLAWTLLVIKTRQLPSESESQSAMIICRVCARRFFQFQVMFTNNKKWRSTQRLVRLNKNMTLHLKKNSSLPSNPLLTIRIPLTYVYKNFLSSSFF